MKNPCLKAKILINPKTNKIWRFWLKLLKDNMKGALRISSSHIETMIHTGFLKQGSQWWVSNQIQMVVYFQWKLQQFHVLFSCYCNHREWWQVTKVAITCFYRQSLKIPSGISSQQSPFITWRLFRCTIFYLSHSSNIVSTNCLDMFKSLFTYHCFTIEFITNKFNFPTGALSKNHSM